MCVCVCVCVCLSLFTVPSSRCVPRWPPSSTAPHHPVHLLGDRMTSIDIVSRSLIASVEVRVVTIDERVSVICRLCSRPLSALSAPSAALSVSLLCSLARLFPLSPSFRSPIPLSLSPSAPFPVSPHRPLARLSVLSASPPSPTGSPSLPPPSSVPACLPLFVATRCLCSTCCIASYRVFVQRDRAHTRR